MTDSKPTYRVLGIHHSGTSRLCGLLETAGVWFGKPADFVQAGVDIPNGLHEHRALRGLNDRLLHSLNCDWAEVSGLQAARRKADPQLLADYEQHASAFLADLKQSTCSAAVGIQDPRLCLFADCWTGVLSDQDPTIFVYRDPREIARRLISQNQLPPPVAFYLIQYYLGSALAAIGNGPVLVTNFSRLIAQPGGELARISNLAASLGLPPLNVNEQLLRAFDDGVLDQSDTGKVDLPDDSVLREWEPYFQADTLPDVAPESVLPESTVDVLQFEHQYRFSRWRDDRSPATLPRNEPGTGLPDEKQSIRNLKTQTMADQCALAILSRRLQSTASSLNRLEDLQQRTERSQHETVISLARLIDEYHLTLNRIGVLNTQLGMKNTDMKSLVTGFDEIRKSLSWRLAERPMRLMMSPASLGRGPVSLDTLYTQTKQLGFSSKKPLPSDSRIPAFTSEKSPLLTSNHFDTSIVVLNRDDSGHLEKLFSSYLDHHGELEAEWVLIDRGSSDDSIAVINRYMASLPIRLIRVGDDLGCAFFNNLGAAIATGARLVFCKNDIVFDQPLLGNLLDGLEQDKVGIAGTVLYLPNESGGRSDTIQHAGIQFKFDGQRGFPGPKNMIVQDNPEPIAVTAALMACKRRDFFRAGGFHTAYSDGFEDVDFSLAMRKLDKRIVLAPGASALYRGRQTSDDANSDDLAARAQANTTLLKSRHGDYVLDNVPAPVGEDPAAAKPFTVGLVVTDDDPATSAGDFFTASELAGSLERINGWKCEFLPRRSTTKNWYDCTGLDCIIVLLDQYDLLHITNASPTLIKIAWLRNWFDLWVQHPWFSRYDLALCSSEFARDWVQQHSAVPTGVLRIASNPESFHTEIPPADQLASDYCFTGSYWNSPREIEQFEPDRLPYQFALFGHGWEDHENFTDSYRGVVPYSDIPAVYASTKLLIDDANHVTRPWGSINSRVFDALAAGVLVITNGVKGAEELFAGVLPTWSSTEELESRVRYFLENEEERLALAHRLRDMVLSEHSYDRRAGELDGIINAFRSRRTIAIKLPVPSWHVAREWGDYHFGSALARGLHKQGFNTRLDILPEWYEPTGDPDIAVIVLRGLSEYKPQDRHINLMWNISHPDKVSKAEYERYDCVFVASEQHATELDQALDVPVVPLLQCTDPDRFFPAQTRQSDSRVVFVGNSRKVRRPVVMSAIEQGLDVEVYGTNWSELIDERYIKGTYIPNEQLGDVYGSAGVVLNDHWETMREYGFISNRLFDAAASGARIISDQVKGIDEVFGSLVYQCETDFADLNEGVRQLLDEDESARLARLQAASVIAQNHSFDERAKIIAAVVESVERFATAPLSASK